MSRVLVREQIRKKENGVLAKCANPACTAKFHYLHEGKLFFVEYGGERRSAELACDFNSPELPKSRQYFWLCPSCSWDMTLQSDDKHGVMVVPRKDQSKLFTGWPPLTTLESCEMANRNVLDALKRELEFVQKGGYRSAVGSRVPFIFEDSPVCTKSPWTVCSSSDCVFVGFVPLKDRDAPIPCRHIVLNDTGNTPESVYAAATNEIEESLQKWLRKTIIEIEQQSEGHSTGTSKVA